MTQENIKKEKLFSIHLDIGEAIHILRFIKADGDSKSAITVSELVGSLTEYLRILHLLN
jgi:hypothetical protein